MLGHSALQLLDHFDPAAHQGPGAHVIATPIPSIPGLPTWASLALASDSLGQSGISGGFTDTGVCDRLNLSRLGLGDTLNLTSLQPLGGDTTGIDDLPGVGAAQARRRQWRCPS